MGDSFGKACRHVVMWSCGHYIEYKDKLVNFGTIVRFNKKQYETVNNNTKCLTMMKKEDKVDTPASRPIVLMAEETVAPLEFTAPATEPSHSLVCFTNKLPKYKQEDCDGHQNTENEP
jgi:hypothetical protein